MRFHPDNAIIERQILQKSGARDPIKGPVLESFFLEYPSLSESVFRDSFMRRVLLEAIFDHSEDGSADLTAAGFLRVLADLFEDRRLKRYQIEDDILRKVFPDGVPETAKREYLWWRQEQERNRSENRSEGDSSAVKRKESPIRIMLRQIGL
ncbi:MAG: hypothetical protein HGA38_01950 [Candidatus Moranbacteria bacterium]|nr:hypothetical protein [Candidatus Moranbacteria bacterium]NTW45520.1 hypothetical protein [Candidatus Moranbacteria bacterium]